MRAPDPPRHDDDDDFQLELLSAWIDGEPAPAAELLRALERDDARDFLRDALRLRMAFEQDSRRPSEHFSRRMTRRLGGARRWWRRGIELPAPLAAMLVLLLTGLLWLGLFGREPDRPRPTEEPAPIEAPAPSRTLQFENWGPVRT